MSLESRFLGRVKESSTKCPSNIVKYKMNCSKMRLMRIKDKLTDNLNYIKKKKFERVIVRYIKLLPTRR